jgi:hypothetical protein
MAKTNCLSPVDYDDVADKPSINGHELVGDQTSSELGLQDDLTTATGYDATKIQILYNNNGTLTWSSSINGGNALEI